MSGQERPSLANRDYPYHDYKSWDDAEEPTTYSVGQENREAQGTQRKLFTSKSTLIFSDVACTIQFNSSNNVVVAINANVWYTFECDIYAVVIVAIGAGGTLQGWFEGVLPDEARTPE